MLKSRDLGLAILASSVVSLGSLSGCGSEVAPITPPAPTTTAPAAGPKMEPEPKPATPAPAAKPAEEKK